MAILYYMKVVNPNNVALYPPSISESAWATTFSTALYAYPTVSSTNGTTLQIFKDNAALTAYTNAIALSGAQQAALTEWKTANNITITYELFELNIASGITIPHVFGD